jgi:hypothetical protein
MIKKIIIIIIMITIIYNKEIISMEEYEKMNEIKEKITLTYTDNLINSIFNHYYKKLKTPLSFKKFKHNTMIKENNKKYLPEKLKTIKNIFLKENNDLLKMNEMNSKAYIRENYNNFIEKNNLNNVVNDDNNNFLFSGNITMYFFFNKLL